MPEASSWRRASLLFQRNKFTVHHFAINHNWFEVAQLVLRLSLLIFATKIVNTILHKIALKQTKVKIKIMIEKMQLTCLVKS